MSIIAQVDGSGTVEMSDSKPALSPLAASKVEMSKTKSFGHTVRRSRLWSANNASATLSDVNVSRTSIVPSTVTSNFSFAKPRREALLPRRFRMSSSGAAAAKLKSPVVLQVEVEPPGVSAALERVGPAAMGTRVVGNASGGGGNVWTGGEGGSGGDVAAGAPTAATPPAEIGRAHV